MSVKRNRSRQHKAIRFGTDGWRAVIADTFTFNNVRLVAQATADYLKSNSKKKSLRVVIGYDTRFLSNQFALAAACVFAGNGIRVVLSDRISPTPAVSFAVKNRKFDLGIVITASHNPPEFNGYKIKSVTGGSADVSLTKAVEKLIGKQKPRVLEAGRALKKKIVVKENIVQDYITFLRSYLDLEQIRTSKFRVLLDAMYGSGNGYMQDVLADTGIYVEVMRNERNPYFEGRGPEPVEEYVEQLMDRMRKEHFDLGLVLDGDADRIAAVVRGGVFLHPQKILGLLALHMYEDRGMTGGIVTTTAGTVLVDHIAKHFGLKFYETPVGFKYISRLMETEDILVGGEEAGGMGFKNYIPERDGTLAGLLLLEMMAFRNESMEKIVEKMDVQFGAYHYLRDAVHYRPGKTIRDIYTLKPKSLLGSSVVKINDHDGVKIMCADESWLMFRPSGTEPLIRIYCEASTLEKAKKLLELGKRLIIS